MAKNSDVETFCALRLFIDSWRWQGIPWYLRSGKYLAETADRDRSRAKAAATEAFRRLSACNGLGQLPAPPALAQLGDRPRRSREGPRKRLCRGAERAIPLEEQPGKEAPYERLLSNAMAGDGALSAREDAVGAACAGVGGGWGPKQADAIIASHGCWHNRETNAASE